MINKVPTGKTTFLSTTINVLIYKMKHTSAASNINQTTESSRLQHKPTSELSELQTSKVSSYLTSRSDEFGTSHQ
jgi:hypothetical protein